MKEHNQLQSRNVIISPDRQCQVCYRPIGEAAFACYPNLHCIHYSCYQQMEVSVSCCEDYLYSSIRAWWILVCGVAWTMGGSAAGGTLRVTYMIVIMVCACVCVCVCVCVRACVFFKRVRRLSNHTPTHPRAFDAVPHHAPPTLLWLPTESTHACV